jgi:uncharacterized RDD family membrane protein YckC
MKPRFEPERDAALSRDRQPRLVDPEAYDAREGRFAASLDGNPRVRSGRFVVDWDAASTTAQPDSPAKPRRTEHLPIIEASDPGPTEVEDALARPRSNGGDDLRVGGAEVSDPPDCVSWRLEVKAKITRYRRRKRPLPPRYPSLGLPSASSASCLGPSSPSAPSPPPPASETTSAATRTAGRGKLLEFFRPSIAPPEVVDELAEPVIDSPRILDVPDVLPPPPALGGILIEPREDQIPKSGLELPLRAAPMIRRVVALAVDGLIVTAAAVLFAYICWKMGLEGLPRMKILSWGAALTALLWAGYQYLLLVYAGSTPGLKLAKLRLSRFDCTPVPRKLRRWRVLASILSGLSLTLGYAWCFLDEDQLCWHDRITQTYMGPLDPP